MKRFILIAIPLYGIAQGIIDIRTNEKVNINKSIHENIHVGGSIYENKTITTIDYGALATANAEMQRLQFERQQYADAKEKQKALEMAQNPSKAYDYGHFLTMNADKKVAESYGFKRFSYRYCIPHKDFFYEAGEDILENISPDGIKTEIIIYAPRYNVYLQDLIVKPDLSFIKENSINDGMGPDGGSIYVYAKSLAKAVVFGYEGYKTTIKWEDEYQFCITDNYSSVFNYANGISFFIKVRYYGTKEETSFEALEGRRFYLRPLIEKVISTAKLNEGFKVCKTKSLPQE